jgi:hypothetical protein
MCCPTGQKGHLNMNSHWQEQLLVLVDHYGQQCAQLAAERERGKHSHPPADRAGAWAAIISHLSHAPFQQPAESGRRTQTA